MKRPIAGLDGKTLIYSNPPEQWRRINVVKNSGSASDRSDVGLKYMILGGKFDH